MAMKDYTKAEAREITASRMKDAGIPLTSVTARCLFERTLSPSGRPECTLGPTPLWDHLANKAADTISEHILMSTLNALVISGHEHQRAGKASMESQFLAAKPKTDLEQDRKVPTILEIICPGGQFRSISSLTLYECHLLIQSKARAK